MKLKKVEIQNFKSIKSEILEIQDNCIILEGINEAGKTNVLNALRSLDFKKFPPSKKDRRESSSEIIKTAGVTFEFEFSKEDRDHIYEKIKEELSIDKKIIQHNEKEYSLKNFCDLYHCIFEIDLIEENSIVKYYTVLNEKTKLIYSLQKVLIDMTLDGKEVKTGTVLLNPLEQITEGFEEVTIETVNKVIYSKYLSFVRENLPNVVFWEYDPVYLLPPKIPYEEFMNNPNTCEPLKNLFSLAGIDNIKESIEDEIERTDDFRNILENVSQKTTAFLKKKWKDLARIKEIKLEKDGTDIKIFIKEEGLFSKFQDRSDGFKRFVSFLIMISTVMHDNEKESLIIIDEPDMSLYPSGAKYLRDELLKLSNSNIVIYSTHSPFMLDYKKVDRHVMVEKDKNDITVFKRADRDNYKNNLLLSHIGLATFEFFKEHSIIFEGWTDVEFFKKALSKKGKKDFKNKFKNFGITNVLGVKDIKNFSKLLHLVNTECYFFTDSDNVALQKQKELNEQDPSISWKTFSDFGAYNLFELEDFYVDDYFEASFKKFFKDSGCDLIKINHSIAKMPQVKNFKNNKEKLRDFKVFLVENMETKHIKEEYYTVLSSFHDYIIKL